MDLTKVDQLVQNAIGEGVFPGCCYAIGHQGTVVIKPAGHFMYCPDSPPVQADTLWDMASVSKVVGCTTAAMICYDEGKLKLDQTVASVLPDFAQNGKEKITVRNLLLHNSGLMADLHNVPQYTSADAFMKALYALKLSYPTGTKMIYSDLSMITLGKMIEKITGQPLDQFLEKRVFEPLGMKDSMYHPPAEQRPRCAPTEPVEEWRRRLRESRHQTFKPLPGCHPDMHVYIQGEVHDPSAAVLDGISGNAGLFSDAHDLSIFMQMMLSEGTYWGRRIVQAETVRQWTRRVNEPEGSTRALGWDTPTPGHSFAGSHISRNSFNHTGFTGTSVIGDFDHQFFAVLLSNRVHPTAENNKLSRFRPEFHNAVAEACGF